MQTEQGQTVADVLKNPATPGWGAVAGVIGLFLAQVTGVTHDLSGKPSSYDARMNEQLMDHSARIERNWNQINQDRQDQRVKIEALEGRINAVERSTDRSSDRMEALRASVDALSGGLSSMTEQVRQLAQVVAVMDNRVETMADGMGKRGTTSGQP